MMRSSHQPAHRAREAAKRVRLLLRFQDALARQSRVVLELLEQLIRQRAEPSRVRKQVRKPHTRKLRAALARRHAKRSREFQR